MQHRPGQSALRMLRVLLSLVVLVASQASLVGCKPKCQALTERFRYLRDTPWRLVSTTNPSERYANLNNVNFEVWTFNDFTGTIQTAQLNQLFTDPTNVFDWGGDEDRDYIYMVVRPGSGTGTGVTYEFNREIGSTLVLRRINGGSEEYRFVPFKGVVKNPEQKCEFL